MLLRELTRSAAAPALTPSSSSRLVALYGARPLLALRAGAVGAPAGSARGLLGELGQQDQQQRHPAHLIYVRRFRILVFCIFGLW